MRLVGKCACGCGVEISLTDSKGRPRRFVKNHRLTGIKSKAWKGGVNIRLDGYITVHIPNHHRANSKGYVREHIVIAEKALQSKLPDGSEVHHVGERGDNTQLVICQDAAYHKLLHVRTKAFYACGDVNSRKCKYCKQYDVLENMYTEVNRSSCGISGYHRECRNIHLKELKEKKQGGK